MNCDNQSNPMEADDPNTGALGDQNEVELCLAGMAPSYQKFWPTPYINTFGTDGHYSISIKEMHSTWIDIDLCQQLKVIHWVWESMQV